MEDGYGDTFDQNSQERLNDGEISQEIEPEGEMPILTADSGNTDEEFLIHSQQILQKTVIDVVFKSFIINRLQDKNRMSTMQKSN